MLLSTKIPICDTEAEIALLMNISVEQLRWIAFKPLTSPLIHYFRFQIQKKTGKQRTIYAPMPHLKATQICILKNILHKLEVHNAAHGFRRDRSIVTNAKPHVGADILIKIDLQNFFQSIDYKQVQELFLRSGYSETAAIIFGLICTIKDVETEKKRHLPQGSPASPAISNLICYALDQHLSQIAQDLGFCYTRYADDLTFSGTRDRCRHIPTLMDQSKLIIAQQGFTINPDKTQILNKSVRQQVTGIVVNQKLNISKTKLKAFRATLYQIEQEGLKDGAILQI
jgi:RNA-directed DNA polymerase